MPEPSPLHSARYFALFLLIALAAVLYRLDRMPLFDPDEGRNARVAAEMLERGEPLVPHFHGMPYLDKPFLHFGAVAISLAVFGRREEAARLPSLVFAGLAIVAIFLLARELFDAATARATTVVLATSPLFFGFARIVIFDMTLTCFVTLAWWCAERGRRGAAWGYPLAWTATALAVMTKGPIGLLLPLLGHVALALGQPGPRRLARALHPLNVLPFVALVAPWLAAVETRVPGFLHYALAVETMERLTRPTLQRTGPLWYFVPVILLGMLPWSLVALGHTPALLRGLRQRLTPSAGRGVALAALGIVGFFSLSSSKLGGYVLPALPLLAILVARAAAMAGERPLAWGVAPAVLLMVLAVAAAVAAFGPWSLAPRLRLATSFEPLVESLLLRIGAVAAAFALGLFALTARRRLAWAPAVLALFLPAAWLAGVAPLTTYAESASARPLATAVHAAGGADRVVALRCFPPGIDWYLGRVVPVVSENGGEITSNWVARHHEALSAKGPGGLWSTRNYEERRATGEVEYLITHRRDDPGGARMLVETQKFRLWRLTAETR